MFACSEDFWGFLPCENLLLKITAVDVWKFPLHKWETEKQEDQILHWKTVFFEIDLTEICG